MIKRHISTVLLTGIMAVSLLAGCGSQTEGKEQNTITEQETISDAEQNTSEDVPQDVSADMEQDALTEVEDKEDVLMIARQGMFSSGGTVTEPVEGEYDPTTNWLDASHAGNTAHVDHANL